MPGRELTASSAGQPLAQSGPANVRRVVVYAQLPFWWNSNIQPTVCPRVLQCGKCAVEGELLRRPSRTWSTARTLPLSMLLGLIALACSTHEPTSLPIPTPVTSEATPLPISTSVPIPTQAAEEPTVVGILGPIAVQPMTVGKIPSIIEITPATVTLSSLGESLEFSAEVRDSSGELLNGIP